MQQHILVYEISCNCRRENIRCSASTTAKTTLSLRQYIRSYAFVYSVQEYASQDLSSYWEEINTSIVSTVLYTFLLENWQDTSIFPVLWSLLSFPDVQNQCVQARGEFHPAMFSEFCRYTWYWCHPTVPWLQVFHQEMQCLVSAQWCPRQWSTSPVMLSSLSK